MCVNQKSGFWRRLWLKEISGNKTFLESWTMSTLVKELPWWLVASGHSQGTKGMTSGAEGQGLGQSTGGTQGYFPNPRNDNPPSLNTQSQSLWLARALDARAEHHTDCPVCRRALGGTHRSYPSVLQKGPRYPKAVLADGSKDDRRAIPAFGRKRQEA